MANEFIARNGIRALQDSQITGSLNLSSHLSASGGISASGFISASTFYGDGGNLFNLPSAAITTYNLAADDRIITSVNGNTVQGEANLTFDGSKLTVTGEVSASSVISASAFSGDGSGLTGLSVAVTSYTNATNDRLVTSTGANGINAEANLLFDGSLLTVTGDVSASGHITGSDIQLTGLLNQGSEATALVINGTNNVGTRELGTAAFSNTGDFSSPAAVSGSFLEITGDSVISASVEGDAQGQIKLNGVNVDINALGTTDNPTFNNLTVSGDLDVQGTLTTISSNQVDIGDRILTLNANNAAGDGGLYVNDTSTNETGSLLWDVSENYWIAGLEGAESEVMTLSSLNTKGVLSSSAFSSPSQGTHRSTINGVDTDVDLGLQTGDSPQFTGLTLTGLGNQASEATAVMINGSNVVGTRELGTAAFNNTGDFASPAAVSSSFSQPSAVSGSFVELTEDSLVTLNGGAVVHGIQYTSGSGVGQTLDNGTFTISSVPTSSYDSAQFDYVLTNETDGNYRTGTVMSVWNQSGTVTYTDVSTTDIGDTTGVDWTVDLLGANARLRLTVPDVTTPYLAKVAVRAL